ncbi:PREDICTED: uncharacterized protein LOC108513518 [Rhinopithecus bieti]|uniref:uncharacterized protein LOC108513518 n=1 Tax=Rhinopithecus bieti TaxID=61621 RepID=UPI00083C7C0E|nr:PREDICTED: uncharacterized protein LOC108513518 [Rhinopithecus bieti]
MKADGEKGKKPGSTTSGVRSRRALGRSRTASASLPRVHQAPIAPAPLRRPWLSRVRHQLPSRAKWECPARKVSTARSDLGLRTGRLCYPGGVAPSLPQLQGGTAARHPILLRLWHQPRHVSARASHAPRLIQQAHSPRPRAHGYLGGRHDSPWLPVTAGPTHWLTGVRCPGGSLPVLAAAAAAARAAIRPGSVRAWPASPRPPAGAGHADAARPLAGPSLGRRGARDLAASALRPGRAQGLGQWRDRDT